MEEGTENSCQSFNRDEDGLQSNYQIEILLFYKLHY